MTGGSGIISGTSGVFNASTDGGGCTTFYVGCLTTGSGIAGVNIPRLHATGHLFPVFPGQSFPFRLYDNGISEVNITSIGGDAHVIYGVLAKTQSE